MSDLNLKQGFSSGCFSDDYQYADNYEIEEEQNNSVNGCIFVKEEDILKERESKIEEAKETLFLERGPAILAMIYYEWNSDKLNMWYEDVETNKYNAGIELSPKLKKIFQSEGVESFGNTCLICDEEKNDTFCSLSCGHQFCGDCWLDYLKENLKSPLGALKAKCPQNKCNCIVGEDIYKKIIKDKNLLEKLDKAIYKNFINRNEDLKQCPNPHCHLYAKSNMHSSREIKCLCGTTYCFKCSKESHRPCNCEMFEKWNILNKSSKNDEKWIEANTKKCPHCGQIIEKSKGCNYMLCDKRAGGCGKAFCYVCETDGSKHTQDHFGCNKYISIIKKQSKY